MLSSTTAHTLISPISNKSYTCYRSVPPALPYTSAEVLIVSEQGRIVNLNDLPTLAPYFFVEPDLNSAEAFSMFKSIDGMEYGMHQGFYQYLLSHAHSYNRSD